MFIKSNKKETRYWSKRLLYDLFVIIVSVGIIYFAAIVRAGNFTPGPIGPSMNSFSEIYDVLAGNYNSGAISAKEDGSVAQMLKCITTKMNDGVCD